MINIRIGGDIFSAGYVIYDSFNTPTCKYLGHKAIRFSGADKWLKGQSRNENAKLPILSEREKSR